jgi:hypothetical protein
MEPGQRMLPRLYDYYTDIIAIDIERIRSDIININAFNATPGRGTTGLTFSAEYQSALNYALSQFNQLGAAVSICPGGNVRQHPRFVAEKGAREWYITP